MVQLRLEKYERVQKEGKTFPRYIQAIKDATKVLRIEETEAQIVRRIVEGLTPSQHARFIFQATPFSFRDVEYLVIVDRNIAYAHQARKATRVEVMETTEYHLEKDEHQSVQGGALQRYTLTEELSLAFIVRRKGTYKVNVCCDCVHARTNFVYILFCFFISLTQFAILAYVTKCGNLAWHHHTYVRS
jgi:hypothetical protein